MNGFNEKKKFLTCPHHCLNRCANWALPLQCFQSAPSGGGTESHPSKPLALPIPLIVCEEIITNGGGGEGNQFKTVMIGKLCEKYISNAYTVHTTSSPKKQEFEISHAKAQTYQLH